MKYTVKFKIYLNESHPDDAANVILLDDDVSEIRGVHVRLQEQLEKQKHLCYAVYVMYTYS